MYIYNILILIYIYIIIYNNIIIIISLYNNIIMIYIYIYHSATNMITSVRFRLKQMWRRKKPMAETKYEHWTKR